MTGIKSTRFPWMIYWAVLLLILLIALAPVISVSIASWTANAHGCALDEGSVHQCVINGRDYGQLLTTMGVSGWLMLMTIPGGALAGVAWLMALILHHASWRKRSPAPRPT